MPRPKSIGALLAEEKSQACLEVQDNGKGFNLPGHWIELARKQHLGLVGSIERAREAGGYLEVNTAPGKGTQMRAVLPIQAEAAARNKVNEE